MSGGMGYRIRQRLQGAARTVGISRPRPSLDDTTDWIQRFGIRRGLRDTREVLAGRALTQNSSLTWEQLRQLLRTAAQRQHSDGAAEWDESLQAQLSPQVVLSLARVLYRQRLTSEDLADAVLCYQWILRQKHHKYLERRDKFFYVQALVEAGDHAQARDAIAQLRLERDYPLDIAYFHANMLRASITQDAVTVGESATEQHLERRWLAFFNEPFVRSGLEPIRLRTDSIEPSPPFYRLSAPVPARSVDGPLVSVIVPVYEADAATEQALASLSAQTWANLEIIVLDDGSSAESVAQLRQWCARDERMTLIECPTNRGAYSVRNEGFARATGQFGTVSDSDDWHHPRKIERHVQHLLKHPDLLANYSSWLRTEEDLTVHMRMYGGPFITWAVVSTMFRLPQTLPLIGFWDPVRKAADTEYVRRLELASGKEIALLPGNPPLAISRHTQANLTGSDMGRGFFSADRTFYRQSWKQFHSQLRTHPEESILAPNQPDRAFSAPHSYLPQPGAPEPVDVLLVAAFNTGQSQQQKLWEEVSQLRHHGLRIGLLSHPSWSYRLDQDLDFASQWLDAFNDNTVCRVDLREHRDCAMVLIRWQDALAPLMMEESHLRTRHVYIVRESGSNSGLAQKLPVLSTFNHTEQAAQYFSTQPHMWDKATYQQFLADPRPQLKQR